MFKSLLRTLPTLSGNFSICCKLNDYNKITSNDYEVCVRDASILSLQDNQYNNEVSINLAKESYEFIIAKYYNLCSNVFYKENYSYNKDSYQKYDKYEVNSNNDARNKDYEFGCKRLHYSYNGYQFNFYAPFYINDLDSLPEYFLLSIYMTDKLVKNIKIFINKEDSNNYLRKFLRKYCNNLDNKVIFCLPESKQATYFGINVKEGGFGQYIDNEFGNLYNTQNTINNFDYIICKGFERNHLIMKQIIPLSFSFNINDLFDDYERKVFSFDKIKIIGKYYNRFNIQENLYDFSIDYNNFNCKYNKYNQLGEYELDYGYDKNNNIINVMNIKYPSLNESKFVKYRFTNKITPKYCRFKLTNSDDNNPYIINMSYAYSNVEEDNNKYGEFPTMFKDIFPVSIIENNNLLLPIGTYYTNKYLENDYLNYLKYKKLMTNFYSSWFNILNENSDIFENHYEWSDVINNYAYFKGVLYNFKNENIDKFSLFIRPKLNYVSNNESISSVVNGAYIYDIKKTDLDFIELNNLSYNHSYNLENNKGTISLSVNIDEHSNPFEYSLLYKYNDKTIFTIDKFTNPLYYKEHNDNIKYNDIYFNIDGDIKYPENFFITNKESNNYVAFNKKLKKDINGNYILVDDYYNRNIYYNINDILDLIKKRNFTNFDYNDLYAYINKNKIIGYEKISINSNNNIYDKDGDIVFENISLDKQNNQNININDIYVILNNSSDKVKLTSVINNLKNNNNTLISIFKKCELIEKKSLFDFLYNILKINNIKYSNNENDIDNYINLLYNKNLEILEDYIRFNFDKSTEIPYEVLRSVILDIISNFYPYYKVDYTNKDIIDKYFTDNEYSQYINNYIIWIQNILDDYNYFAQLLRNNIFYLKYGDITIIKKDNIDKEYSFKTLSDASSFLNITQDIFELKTNNGTWEYDINGSHYIITNDKYDHNNEHKLILYNTTEECSLLTFLYNDLINTITTYNYVPYSIDDNNNVIKDYYVKNINYQNDNIYVDSFNVNSLIYQYNYRHNYSNKNTQYIDYVDKNSTNYEIEEKYGEFLNLNHIKKYIEVLYNDENYKWNNSSLNNKNIYISVINNVYVKERVWVFKNGELLFKDKYTVLSEYLININKKSKNNDGYKYINDLFIVNTIYKDYDKIDYELPENEDKDPLYNEQYYKYANEIFFNIICSKYKNTNNKFVLKLDDNTNIELTLVFKKNFIKLNDNLFKILKDGYYMYLYKVDYDSLNTDNWDYIKSDENVDNDETINSDETVKTVKLKSIDNFISPLFKDIQMNDNDSKNISSIISNNKINENKYYRNTDVFMYVDIYEYFKDYIIKNSIIEKDYNKFKFINKYIDNDTLFDYIFKLLKSEWPIYLEDYYADNKISNIDINNVNIDIDTVLLNLNNVLKTNYTKRIQINEDFINEMLIIFSNVEYNDNIFINYDDYSERSVLLKSLYNNINSTINLTLGKQYNALIKNMFNYVIENNDNYKNSFFRRIFNNDFIKNIVDIYLQKIDELYFRKEIINNYLGINLYSIYNTNISKYNKNISYDNSKYDLIETSSNLNILLDKETNKKYGFFIIDFEFDNTNNSINVEHQYNISSAFETINGKSINENNYINKIFKVLNPFFKENIFKAFTLNNLKYIVFPNELDINIIYNSVKLNKDEEYKYKMLKEYEDDKLYENIIKLNKPKKMKMLRYFTYIEPLIVKTSIIKNLWEYKFIDDNDYSTKYNILYKSDININKYNGVYLCKEYDNIKHIENKYSIVNQYEYKHYNDNSFYNLNESIVITIDKLVEYDDIVNIYQTPERTYEEFKKYINKVNKNIDDLNIILFLYNKYTVSYSSEQIKLDSTKSKKLYKISYKFNLK